ncbi:MAG: LptF/LptG family permease [Spirochaetes bacterium]|nr:LptF/LptG family permease [Spirochaetota bacterium]
MKRITIYIAKEQLFPFLTGFLFFTFILMLQQLFTLADLIINKDVEFILVLKLFLSVLPITMSLTVPMSVLFSSIMALGRLSNDSEIVAFRAAGISFINIIKPVLFTGFCIFVLMGIFNETVNVYSSKVHNKILIEILKSSPAAMLEDEIFTSLGDRTIRVEEIDKESRVLKNIMIFNRNESSGWDIIRAHRGKWQQNEDASKTLILYSGKIFSSKINSGTFSVVDFSKGNAEILLSESKIDYKIDNKISPSEMNSSELYKMLKTQKKSYKEDRDIALFWIELYKKMSVPFSCFVFVLIGAPVGISYHRSSKGIGFGISIVIFFLYYIFSMAGQSLAIRGLVSPFIGVWYPNIILAIAGCILIFIREKS